MSWHETIITDAGLICDDVVRLELEYPVRLSAFDPGSHVDVVVHIDGREETRSYSVVERTGERRLVVSVRRLDGGRGGSRYMHGLRTGHRLRANLPRNHFTLGADAPFVLLLAGGIGVTPLIGMARTLKRSGAPLRFAYLGRSRSSMPFLETLAEELGDALELWIDDETGRPDFGELVASLPRDAEIYMCGPAPMMEAVHGPWEEAGRPASGLRFETFGDAGGKAATPFRVIIPARGIEIEVPADRSFLDMLLEAGAEPLFSCRRGECGLCVVDVLALDGSIDHRDGFFTERQRRENAYICACVSRVVGTVTIKMP